MAFLVFILLCFVSMTVGAGVLYILGFRDREDELIIISPLVTLCFWAVFLGMGVSLGVTVRTLSYMIWPINLLLSVLAFRYFHFRWFFPLFIGFIAVALLVSIPYLTNGFGEYAGSPSPDGWSYVAFGQYLWEYPNCSEGGLAPLYQYSAHLCHTRFVAASLLGLISPLTGFPGDTQAASGYFLPFSFFIYAATCYFFFKKNSLSRFSWTYVILCVVSGWSFYIMIYNNIDQALSLGFLPALVGLISSFMFSENRHVFLLALMLSAVFYTYPELSPMIFASSILMLAYFIHRDRVGFLLLLKFGGWFLLVFAPLVVVYARTWLNFLVAQFYSSQAVVRPGGAIASELLRTNSWLAGIWGLPVSSNPYIMFPLNGLALVLTILAVLGLLLMVRDRRWGLTGVFLFLFTLITYFIVVQQYGYGAYKLITLWWWLACYAVVYMVDRLEVQFRGSHLTADWMGWGVTLLLISLISVNVLRQIRYDDKLEVTDIKPYRELQSLDQIVFDSPVGVYVNDPEANLWAMYFLRDLNVFFFEYQSYPAQTHVLPLMARSRDVDLTDIRYVLTDAGAGMGEVVLGNSVYSLTDIKDKSSTNMLLLAIENPNGLETVDNQPFFWMGSQPVKISLIVFDPGWIEISGKFIPGPSLPDVPGRRISVSTDTGYHTELDVMKTPSFKVPVVLGKNEITFQSLDDATAFRQTNGDTRILLVGVSDFKVIYTARP